MKYLLFIAVLAVALFANNGNQAKKNTKPTQKEVAAVNNAFYSKECGSCHFAYQAGLLPENAWRKMMNNLENHFDTDASLDKEEYMTILNYLVANSAEKNMQYKRSAKIVKSIKVGQIPESISKTPYMIEKHNDIRADLITQKEVKGIFNCMACHTTADRGIYTKRDIKIPNYGAWKE
ncbi:MAG: diheme cytochrome c [Arcobacteraceae bacterium]